MPLGKVIPGESKGLVNGAHGGGAVLEQNCQGEPGVLTTLCVWGQIRAQPQGERTESSQLCPKDTSQRPAEIIYAVGKATELLDQGTEK